MKRKAILVTFVLLLLWVTPAYATDPDPTPTPAHSLDTPDIDIPEMAEDIDDYFGMPPQDTSTNLISYVWALETWTDFMFSSAASVWFGVSRTYGLWYIVLTMGLIVAGLSFVSAMRSARAASAADEEEAG